ncbi:prepilin peptidase [Mycobacterium sp. pV006]|uniref:prepilin peptidase n=1 Tax=Mycobacterium sp. pV006 TaxID=3238983 RepID=UPI00351B8E93
MGEVAAVVVAVWLIALSAFDFRVRRLPNWLTLPGAAAILTAAAICGHGSAAVLGAAALFGLYAAVHLVVPRAMGAGDVKLAAGLGALTGAFGLDVWLLAALGAPVLTVAVGGCSLVRGTGSVVPHGPSMCASTAAVIYLHTAGMYF